MAPAAGGGGGGGTQPVPLLVSLSYPINLTGEVGTPIQPLKPTLNGLPPGTPTFTVSGAPPGLAIDALTGVISGTPSVPVTNLIFSVKLTVSGHSGQVSAAINANIVPAPIYLWSQVSDAAPQLLKTDLVTIGGALYVIGVTTPPIPTTQFTWTMQTWRSGDGGLTWTNMNVAPAAQVRHFAVASDGTTAYLSGGSDLSTGTNSSKVWKFDGTAWAEVVVSVPFPPRRRHAMVLRGASLYVIGGVGNAAGAAQELTEATSGYLNDVWRSDDQGASWMQVTSAAAFPARFGHCAISFAGLLYVVGGYDGTQTLPVYESADGQTWTQVAAVVAPAVPPRSLAYSACAVHDARIVLTGGDPFFVLDGRVQGGQGDRVIFYSGNGSTWTHEVPRVVPGSNFFSGRHSHGLTVLGTRLIMAGGTGTATVRPGPLQDVWKTQ